MYRWITNQRKTFLFCIVSDISNYCPIKNYNNCQEICHGQVACQKSSFELSVVKQNPS